VQKARPEGDELTLLCWHRTMALVQFVQKGDRDVPRQGPTFTTPYTLGQYLLMDYMSRKTKAHSLMLQFRDSAGFKTSWLVVSFSDLSFLGTLFVISSHLPDRP